MHPLGFGRRRSGTSTSPCSFHACPPLPYRVPSPPPLPLLSVSSSTPEPPTLPLLSVSSPSPEPPTLTPAATFAFFPRLPPLHLAAFCVATFLAHAPKNTILSAAKMSKRTRDYGSAGFLNVMGEAQAGWVGYEDNLQARSMQKRQERVLS
eukprot:758610-Hanusia_phi.AAC.1